MTRPQPILVGSTLNDMVEYDLTYLQRRRMPLASSAAPNYRLASHVFRCARTDRSSAFYFTRTTTIRPIREAQGHTRCENQRHGSGCRNGEAAPAKIMSSWAQQQRRCRRQSLVWSGTKLKSSKSLISACMRIWQKSSMDARRAP